MNECRICGETDCNHIPPPNCHHQTHVCAGCLYDYYDCTGDNWAEGKNGITYCSQECADRFGRNA